MSDKRIKKDKFKGIYEVWSGMKARCLNPKNPAYRNYGGRGIKVCDEWLNFKNFKEDMQTEYLKGLTLDRINNNKGYSKENCRWATRKEQALNTRNIGHARRITYQGVTLTIREWAEKIGIARNTLYMRLAVYKWSTERALTDWR